MFIRIQMVRVIKIALVLGIFPPANFYGFYYLMKRQYWFLMHLKWILTEWGKPWSQIVVAY